MLRDDETAPTLTPREVTAILSEASKIDSANTDRYSAQAVLGQGGMGEVLLAKDTRIGREVAMKMIRSDQGGSDGDIEARFVREACIQGQLEHPAIVPVYDLGNTPNGDTYFTMRRVRGQTLKDVLKGLRESDPAMLARFSRRKLLSAFSNICLAIDFAHTRGIVHRDLKPANIMLGDFGEVYVIDWGLAKTLESLEASAQNPLVQEENAPKTGVGMLLGTAGYMAPEQARGLDTVNARTDVFALGAILFEILTFDPLVPKASRLEMIESVIRGVEARASLRAPDLAIAPELEAVCVNATAYEQDARLASARLLHDAIERYLDGDRDLKMRRDMAAKHADAADVLIACALTGASDADSEEEDRSRAMRELGRALALDPDSSRAPESMARLLLTPPRQRPKALTQVFAEKAAESQRRSGRFAVLAYVAWFFYTPLYVWLGAQDWNLGAITWGGIALTIVINLIGSRTKSSKWAATLRGIVSIAVSTTVIGLLSRMFGPLVFVPALATANTIAYLHTAFRHRVALMLGFGVSAVLVPLALEATGLWPSSYVFKDGMMCIVPQMTGLEPAPAIAFLTATAVGGIVVSGMFVARVRGLLAKAEEQLHVYTWHLQQLLPAPRASDQKHGVLVRY